MFFNFDRFGKIFRFGETDVFILRNHVGFYTSLGASGNSESSNRETTCSLFLFSLFFLGFKYFAIPVLIKKLKTRNLLGTDVTKR